MKLNGVLDFISFFLILVGVCSSPFFYRCLRSKGYLPTSSVLMMAVILGLSLAVGRTSSQFMFSHSTEQTTHQFGPLIVGTLWITLYTSMAWALPKRANRRYGKRKVLVPFRVLSAACAITAVLVLFLDLETTNRETKVKAAQGLIAGCLIFYAIHRRVRHASSIEEVKTQDPRPPVIYLRAFNQEEEFFSYGTRSWKEVLIGMALRRNEKPALSLEEFLHDAIVSKLGPFLALGSPEDYVPPAGAVRSYADDNTWQEYFVKLAKEARCFLLEVNHSSNLAWELSTLHNMGLGHKIIIVRKPHHSITARIKIWIFRLIRGIKRPPDWAAFTSEMRSLGYSIDIPDPGSGSVIAFNQSGSALALTRFASTPEQYVGAVSSWLYEVHA
jgi:hypothetical protein